MNRFDTSEKHLQALHPGELDKEFLGDVADAVFVLMPQGQVDVEAVASLLSIHPARLRRKVKDVTGLTASNYFYVLRLRKVISMLDAWPRYTITQIGQMCGFADNAHFTHAFKRWIGTSPSSYVARGKG